LSTRSRSPRGGSKGAPQKKTKRAKSEFKGKKKSSAPTTEVGTEDTRKRTLEALEHLGHQKLSNEEGGYNLQSWLKSMRTLLEDFEEKVGSSSLSEEFRAKRKEFEDDFSKVQGTSQVESEIEEVRKEEGDIRAKLKEESERISARLSAIGGEKTSKSKDLDEERAKLRTINLERSRASIVSKLFGRSGPPAEPQEKRVKELEDALKMLEEETTNLQTVRRALEGAREAAGGIYEDLWKRLEALEKRTAELVSMREVRMQLVEEREKAASALHKSISDLKLESPT